jgi:hypothetical protein
VKYVDAVVGMIYLTIVHIFDLTFNTADYCEFLLIVT